MEYGTLDSIICSPNAVNQIMLMLINVNKFLEKGAYYFRI